MSVAYSFVGDMARTKNPGLQLDLRIDRRLDKVVTLTLGVVGFM